METELFFKSQKWILVENRLLMNSKFTIIEFNISHRIEEKIPLLGFEKKIRCGKFLEIFRGEIPHFRKTKKELKKSIYF